MRQLSMLLVVLIVEIRLTRGTCTGSAVLVSNQCYTLVTTMVSFEEALSSCDGTLLKIASSEDRDAVAGLINNKGEFYIGLTDLDNDGIYRWQDGTECDPCFWRKPPKQSHKLCVTMSGTSYEYSEVQCHIPRGYLCSQDPTTTPTTTTTPPTPTTTHPTPTPTPSTTNTTSKPTTTELTTTTTSPTTTTSTKHNTTSLINNTSPVNSNSSCFCPCSAMKANAKYVNLTETALKDLVSETKKKLVVNKTTLSTYKARHVSASDKRVSSTVIGSTSVLLLTFSAGFLVLLDFITFCNYITKNSKCLERTIKPVVG